MNCTEIRGKLLELVEGELPDELAAEIRAHLQACPACEAAHRETRELVGNLGAARSVQDQQWRSTAAEPAALPAALRKLEPHARIADFEILAEIGRGGMGVVYRARQVTLNRIVALKVLNAALLHSERAIERFQREAQAAARLHHTNIVPIYAQGVDDGYFFYAMELIEGQSLDDLLREQSKRVEQETPPESSASSAGQSELESGDRRAATGSRSMLRRSVGSLSRLIRHSQTAGPRRDFKLMARWIAEVADGLHHAHEQDVVHRDIKPQNLLLGTDNRLHITDFGLARLMDAPGLTLSSELVGTPVYMAPEQIRGGAGIDRRTDVYALGATLYEMLTLRCPFHGQTYDEVIHKVLRRDPTSPRRLDPRVPTDLETICLRAMEKEPGRRFATAQEMARELRRYAEDFPIVSRRLGPLGRARRWARRNPARATAGGLLVLLAVLLPTMAGLAVRYANLRIAAAFESLLADYHQDESALAQLGWLGSTFGNARKREMVLALASVIRQPRRTIEVLAPQLETPGDPDAHYLAAWACRRLSRQDTAYWEKARGHIALGDQQQERAGAAGYFFRGLALIETAPMEAQASFEKAIDKKTAEPGDSRASFTLAMLHQGRAIQQIMYLVDDIESYQLAVTRLSAVAHLQKTNPYPWYYLSNAHRFAAEHYRRRALRAGREGADERPARERMKETYEACLDAALSAQRVDPTSPVGFQAEAAYHESVADYSAAIHVWRRFAQLAKDRATAADWSERFAYQMRLHFWLGEYDEAEQMRAQRYSAVSGYDPTEEYDADEAFSAALIAASAHDLQRAAAVVDEAVERVRGRPEEMLMLAAAFRLLGRAPPEALLAATAGAETQLSHYWTPPLLRLVQASLREDLAWEAIDAEVESLLSAHTGEPRRLARPFLMSAARFFAGVSALAAGRRAEARQHFEHAANHHDAENYCFWARFILHRLDADPAWPAWLKTAPESP